MSRPEQGVNQRFQNLTMAYSDEGKNKITHVMRDNLLRIAQIQALKPDPIPRKLDHINIVDRWRVILEN